MTETYTPFSSARAVLEEAEWLSAKEGEPYRIEWCGDHFIAIADHLPHIGRVIETVGERS